MPKKYKVISIQHNGNKGERYTDRTDGRYPLRVGRICEFGQVFMGLPLVIRWVKDQNGNDYCGTLRRSKVKCLWQSENILTAETINTIYRFEIVKTDEVIK
jgi:hypothetical protein